MSPNTEHVVAVTQAPPPKDASALHSFLGLTSWSSKLIPNYATVVEPLRALLCKDADFSETDAAHTQFERVKISIANSPALALFNPTLTTIVTTDHLIMDLEQCSLNFMRTRQRKQ